MDLTITLPLPERILSPNARPHFQAKAKAVRSHRVRAKIEMLVMLPVGYRPKYKKAETRIKWYTKTTAHPDGDNALSSCKSYFDGVTDSGFLSDDRGLKHHPVEFFKDKTNPRIEITFTVE